VRQNAYQVLHLSIADAINMRSPDFTGVMTCTPNDTLASILTYVRERRCHRFVIVEPEDVPARDGQPPRKKGSLVGVLSLSDVLRFLVGYQNLKGMEVPGLGASLSTPSCSRASPLALADPLPLLPSLAGVHGLRGVESTDPNNPTGPDFDADTASITDGASSIGGGSKAASRRGSEATTDAGGSTTDLRAQGLALDDVIEGKAVE